MKIILLGERPVSWNTFYKGRHWTYRRILAEDIHQKIEMTIRAKYGRKKIPIIKHKVKIKVTAYYKKNHIDSDNIPAKIYCDGLKGLLINNDDPRYVGPVTTHSRPVKAGEKERLEIEITKDNTKY